MGRLWNTGSYITTTHEGLRELRREWGVSWKDGTDGVILNLAQGGIGLDEIEDYFHGEHTYLLRSLDVLEARGLIEVSSR